MNSMACMRNHLEVIRSRAPLRLGFAGGGTDVAPYSERHGGYVLNSTIDMYAYCTIVPRTDDRIILRMPDMQLNEDLVSAQQLEPAGPFRLVKGVYNRVMRNFPMAKSPAFGITTYSDAPIGSGLGASSTMVVAILSAFAEWLSLPLGEYDLAHLAYEIERLDLGLEGGKQDHYAAAFGGTNFIEFYAEDRVVVNPLRVKEWIIDELESKTVLYYTGVSRESAQIIKQQMLRGEAEDAQYLQVLDGIKHGAVQMKQALLKGNLDDFSRLLGASWREKKNMATGISNSEIDRVYDLAMNAGAISGKVSGAGGGGFMMFMVDPWHRRDVERVLREQSGMVMSPHFVSKGAQSWKTHAFIDP